MTIKMKKWITTFLITLGVLSLVTTIIVYCLATYDPVVDLGNGYITDRYRLWNNQTDDYIPKDVFGHSYNKNFIIAKQKPSRFDEAYETKYYTYKHGRDSVYYWLIVKDEYLVLGPLDYEEFQEARKEYNVPDKLKFSKKGR